MEGLSVHCHCPGAPGGAPGFAPARACHHRSWRYRSVHLPRWSRLGSSVHKAGPGQCARGGLGSVTWTLSLAHCPGPSQVRARPDQTGGGSITFRHCPLSGKRHTTPAARRRRWRVRNQTGPDRTCQWPRSREHAGDTNPFINIQPLAVPCQMQVTVGRSNLNDVQHRCATDRSSNDSRLAALGCGLEAVAGVAHGIL